MVYHHPWKKPKSLQRTTTKHDPTSLFSRIVKDEDSKISKSRNKINTPNKLANNPLFLAINRGTASNLQHRHLKKQNHNNSVAPVARISSKVFRTVAKKQITNRKSISTRDDIKENVKVFTDDHTRDFSNKYKYRKSSPLSPNEMSDMEDEPEDDLHENTNQSHRNSYLQPLTKEATSKPVTTSASFADSFYDNIPRAPKSFSRHGRFENSNTHKDKKHITGSFAIKADSLTDISHINNTDSSKKAVEHFSIKNASLPQILVLSNLASGTTAVDVKSVLQNIGVIEQCATYNHPDNSVTAEIVFLNHAIAESTARQFDGALADGQIIRASVSRNPSILSTPLPVGGHAQDRHGNVSSNNSNMSTNTKVQSKSLQSTEMNYPPLHRDTVTIHRTRTAHR